MDRFAATLLFSLWWLPVVVGACHRMRVVCEGVWVFGLVGWLAWSDRVERSSGALWVSSLLVVRPRLVLAVSAVARGGWCLKLACVVVTRGPLG